MGEGEGVVRRGLVRHNAMLSLSTSGDRATQRRGRVQGKVGVKRGEDVAPTRRVGDDATQGQG